MAQLTLYPPDSDYKLPNTGDVSVEQGHSFKEFIDRSNTMFAELYGIIGGGTLIVLRGPDGDDLLPNQRDFTVERGDTFKTIIDEINTMFTEIYSITGGSTAAQVTLRGPKFTNYLPATRDFTLEHGDSYRTIILQMAAMFTECYANAGGGGNPVFLHADMSVSTAEYWAMI